MSAGQGGYGGGGFGPPGGQPPGGFGQPQQPGFGQPQHPAQQPQQAQQPGFGQPQQPGFGQPQQPGFGQPQQPGFGQPQGGPGAYGRPPGGGGGAYGPPPGGGFGAPPNPDASQGSVGEMFSNFGLLAKRSMAGIAWVYILFALLSFVLVTLPQTLINGLKIQALTSGDPFVSVGIVTLLGYGFSFLALVLGIVIGTLQAGLARAARVALVDGTPALGGFGGVLKLSYARFWQVLGCLLLYALGIVIGAVFCLLPGLAVAYVGMAGVYLCASRDEGPWDALMHSFRLTTKYIGPCIVLILAALIVVGVVLGINVGLMAGLTALLGVWGTFASTLIVTLLAIPVGLIMWLLGMATFVTIETAESQVAISK